MRKLILFSASSIDFYIARKDGSIDWLFSDNNDYGFHSFYTQIDSILVGHNTFKEALETDKNFPDPKHTYYVFSKKRESSDWKNVNFIRYDIAEFVEKMKNLPGKNIWLMGGAQINELLYNAGLIDEIILSVHPIILGQGIPLLGKNPHEEQFEVKQVHTYDSGLIQITYRKELQ
jgi:dihydrofolate reductase